jgi:hypothetical protein
MSRSCNVGAYDPDYMHALEYRDQEVEIQDYKVLVERLEKMVSLSLHFYIHDAPKQTKQNFNLQCVLGSKLLLSVRIFEYIGVCTFVLYVHVKFRMHWNVQ